MIPSLFPSLHVYTRAYLSFLPPQSPFIRHRWHSLHFFCSLSRLFLSTRRHSYFLFSSFSLTLPLRTSRRRHVFESPSPRSFLFEVLNVFTYVLIYCFSWHPCWRHTTFFSTPPFPQFLIQYFFYHVRKYSSRFCLFFPPLPTVPSLLLPHSVTHGFYFSLDICISLKLAVKFRLHRCRGNSNIHNQPTRERRHRYVTAIGEEFSTSSLEKTRRNQMNTYPVFP